MNFPLSIKFSKEVELAQKKGLPLVALESALITFGMPYPKNLEVARRAEEVVREEGAVPATIAIFEGILHIGLQPEEIEFLAKAKSTQKVGERDISRVLFRGQTGGTTVSATLAIASNQGIKVFVTGGIGGVHRGFAQVLDISQDLGALARYQMFLVSSGAKAILDIPNTLEAFETLGVPVLGYRTNRFPAFFSSRSQYIIERIETAEEAVQIGALQWRLGMPQGILIANPIPMNVELPDHEVDIHVKKALQSLENQKIQGKDRTPFLLRELDELTKGESVEANIHLILNNAKIGARIAQAWNELQKHAGEERPPSNSP